MFETAKGENEKMVKKNWSHWVETWLNANFQLAEAPKRPRTFATSTALLASASNDKVSILSFFRLSVTDYGSFTLAKSVNETVSNSNMWQLSLLYLPWPPWVVWQKIEMFLSLLCRPRWPRQVQRCAITSVTRIIAPTFANVNIVERYGSYRS